LPPNRPEEALGEGIMPARSWGDEDLVESHAFHPTGEHVAVDGVAIPEQVLGGGFFWEGLDQLLGGSRSGWVIGHIDVDEFPALVPKDDEPEEQAERQGWDHEEVDSADVIEVSIQEGAPPRGRPG